MKYLIILLLAAPLSAQATEYCKYIALKNNDCAWFAIDSTLLLIDNLQTHKIASGVIKHDGTRSKEANKILGPYPSNTAINLYFAAWVGISYAVNKWASSGFKHLYNAGLIGVQVAVINHNYSVGIRIKFN